MSDLALCRLRERIRERQVSVQRHRLENAACWSTLVRRVQRIMDRRVAKTQQRNRKLMDFITEKRDMCEWRLRSLNINLMADAQELDSVMDSVSLRKRPQPMQRLIHKHHTPIITCVRPFITVDTKRSVLKLSLRNMRIGSLRELMCELHRVHPCFSRDIVPIISQFAGHDSPPVFKGRCRLRYKGHVDSAVHCVCSLGGGRVVTGAGDGVVHVWCVVSGRRLLKLLGHTKAVRSVADAKRNRLISSSDDYTVRLWDLGAGQCLRMFGYETNWVVSACVLSDARRVVSGNEDDICVWSLETGRYTHMIQAHSNYVTSLLPLQRTLRLVSTSSDCTLRVWDMKTMACQRTLKGHTAWVSSVAATCDERQLISGGGDKTLRVWDIETGECLRVLYGHTGAVRSVAVFSDGLRIMSGATDATLRVWNLQSGVCMYVVGGQLGVVRGVCEVAANQVATVSFDSVVSVWE